MGLFKWAFETKKKNKTAISEFEKENKKYGNLINKYRVDYMGGHLELEATGLDGGKLEILEKAIVFKPTMQSHVYLGFKIPYIDIKDIQLVTEKDIHHDVTLTRMLLTGGYAFGLKKKRVDTERYIIITLVTNGIDYNVVFKVGLLGQRVLNDILRNLQNVKRPNEEKTENVISTDIAGQIEKLADLKEKGILTEEEFSAKKTDLLSRI